MTAAAMDDLRFGVNLMTPLNRDDWIARVRRAEGLGVDVLAVPDHLGMHAPFPSMQLAADVTDQMQVCSYVLDTAFYNPTLLARDVASLDRLTGGRVEIGLGAGYIEDEYIRAGIEFPGAPARIDHLERVVATMRDWFASSEREPRPARPGGPPLMLGGRGDRLLRLAARVADVVSFTGAASGGDGRFPAMGTAESLDERVGWFARHAKHRAQAPVRNVLAQRIVVTDDPDGAARRLVRAYPEMGLDVEDVLAVPMFLFGTPGQIADELLRSRDRWGFTYVTTGDRSLDALARVIEVLRR